MALILYVPPALLIHELAQRSTGLSSVEENHKAGLIFVSFFVVLGTLSGVLASHISFFNLSFLVLSYIVYEALAGVVFRSSQLSVRGQGQGQAAAEAAVVGVRALTMLPG